MSILLLETDASNATSKDPMKVAEELKTKYEIVEEPDHEEFGMAWDDVSGAELDPGKVRKARAEEVEYVRKMRLYEKVPVTQCYQRIGKPPITVRWIDINKGDVQSPNYSSRLVARRCQNLEWSRQPRRPKCYSLWVLMRRPLPKIQTTAYGRRRLLYGRLEPSQWIPL